MFDLNYLLDFITPAYAAGTEVPSVLGNYPVLQFFGGLAIISVSVLSFVWGNRIRKYRGSTPQDTALEDLQRDILLLVEKHNQKLREDVSKQLSENRRVMYERTENLTKVVTKLERDVTERMHQVELDVARLPHPHRRRDD